jgi:hypothetical protein
MVNNPLTLKEVKVVRTFREPGMNIVRDREE